MVAYGTQLSALAVQAATPLAGVALQNATPTLLSWTTPADGQLHRFTYFCAMDIAVTQVGGNVNIQWSAPDGSAQGYTLFVGGQGAGQNFTQTFLGVLVQAGSAVNIVQTSALTSGAATLWAEIWGL
jgi:hypothetical protein